MEASIERLCANRKTEKAALKRLPREPKAAKSLEREALRETGEGIKPLQRGFERIRRGHQVSLEGLPANPEREKAARIRLRVEREREKSALRSADFRAGSVASSPVGSGHRKNAWVKPSREAASARMNCQAYFSGC
jgi:asparagine synthetase B (glutamine-hydrolysing)